MIKKLFSIIGIFILLVNFTGCWDYRDINKKNILLAVGLDYTDKKYRFVIETAQIRVLQKEAVGQKELTKLTLAEGKTYAEARRELEHRNAFPVFLGTVRVIIFDKDAAEKGIEDYINRIKKIQGYRKTTLVVVSKQKTDKILSVKPNNDVTAAFMVNNIVENVDKVGYDISKSTGDILSDIAMKKIGYVLPYIEVKEGVLHYAGAAVMKDSKMIGMLDADDKAFRGLSYILAEHPKAINVVSHPEDEKDLLYFDTKAKKSIKTDYKDGKIIIDVNLKASSKIKFQYYVKPPITDKVKFELEQAISDDIKNEIEIAIKRSQDEFKIDIMNFAKYFRAQNPKIYKKIDWIKEYPLAQINVKVDTKINNLGTTDSKAKGVFEGE
ncbi:Ger(x)C family spore germination protein [Clostridium ganghwense]|uniref:Ger(X)C family spore germination protein n=1 Tax=Clostridium ganghwense TaxID=312089 RepID=A0ABT4CLF4_9CLOT|nr:Ger(x)C family spore germination protein [Clostridium ganghwense]MCY6369877.1 Ger(x)C family spore germination protein [Clostridium ganghwense]